MNVCLRESVYVYVCDSVYVWTYGITIIAVGSHVTTSKGRSLNFVKRVTKVFFDLSDRTNYLDNAPFIIDI